MSKLKKILSVAVALCALSLCACGNKDDGSNKKPSPPPAGCVHVNTTGTPTKLPTCTADGIMTYKCDDCHATVRTEAIPANGHNYENVDTTGLCKTCGVKIATLGLAYELSADGEYYIVSGYGSAQGSKVVIPERHDGKPVKRIKDEAFSEKAFITGVSIPKSMEVIGLGAFASTKITEIYFDAENCEDFARRNNTFLPAEGERAVSVVVGRNVKRLPSRMFYPFVMSPNAITGVNSVTFESGCKIEKIGEYTFYKSDITSIELPDTLREIEKGAFEGSALESVKLGGPLDVIGDYAFNYCVKLKEIDLSASSAVKIGHSAFKNDAALERVTLPAADVSVAERAFYGCTALAEINLGGATAIRDEAFAGCTALTEVKLGKAFKTLGGGAFSGCTALSKLDIAAESMDDLASGNNAFCGAGGSAGVAVTFSDGVKRIPARLFYSSTNVDENMIIRSLYVADGVETVGDYAFFGVTLSDGATVTANLNGVSVGAGNSVLTDVSGGRHDG